MTAASDSPAPSSAGLSTWVRMATGFSPVLADAAGAGAFLCAVNLDLASGEACGPVTFVARVERATRTLAFVSGDARDAAGALVASASAVFRRG